MTETHHFNVYYEELETNMESNNCSYSSYTVYSGFRTTDIRIHPELSRIAEIIY